MKRVGILGYGSLGKNQIQEYHLDKFSYWSVLKLIAQIGKYLCQRVLEDSNFELVYVLNRSEITDPDLDKKSILQDINEFHK